jgi:hypothetical protein
MPWNKENATPPSNPGSGWPRIVRLLVRLGGALAIIAAVLDMVMIWSVYADYPDCPLPQVRFGLWHAALRGPLWWALGGIALIVLSLRKAGR